MKVREVLRRVLAPGHPYIELVSMVRCVHISRPVREGVAAINRSNVRGQS